ncbi:MAG TPA: hypothetical protein PK605_01095 [Ignavibacteria bacterium]|nr:hypothetical protein [Ignavibacteria bacterium]HAX50276.1 hypothetical protein [Bacteroidota bacterium]HRE09746.1 hypothetical protein [Ignavibacteria bacterium]HRF65527.1 hypothetical protein [Ignavibacteria bacterium]HRJ02977.1 hypothetical protein [Ignavibacteria bacterium]
MDITKIHLLLNHREFKKFGDFIRSPYFNSEPRFIKLYDILALNSNSLSRGLIAEKFFGSAAVSKELRFRKLVSEFMKLYRAFTAQAEYDKCELTKRKMELRWMRKKKDIEGYLKLAVDTDSFIKENFDKDEEYYLELTVLHSKIYDFKDTSLDESKNDFSITINDYLDKYFAAMKLFLLQRMDSLQYTANIDATEFRTFEKSIFEYIETNKTVLQNEHPEIYLRYLAIQLDRNGFRQDLYNEYLETLLRAESIFRINDSGLLLTLLNMISKFINSGRNDLSDKVIEIAQILYDKQIILNKGIGYVDLKIIIEAAIGLGKFDWALDYMHNTKGHIKYEYPDNVYNMFTAKILFFKHEYRSARLLLSKISIDDYIFYCEAKLIECRIAYIGGDHESVLQICEVVKKYLKSHKNIGKHFIAAYSNFIFIIKQLTMLQLLTLEKNELEYRLLTLEKEMAALNSPCYASNWLQEQIVSSKSKV